MDSNNAGVSADDVDVVIAGAVGAARRACMSMQARVGMRRCRRHSEIKTRRREGDREQLPVFQRLAETAGRAAKRCLVPHGVLRNRSCHGRTNAPSAGTVPARFGSRHRQGRQVVCGACGCRERAAPRQEIPGAPHPMEHAKNEKAQRLKSTAQVLRQETKSAEERASGVPRPGRRPAGERQSGWRIRRRDSCASCASGRLRGTGNQIQHGVRAELRECQRDSSLGHVQMLAHLAAENPRRHLGLAERERQRAPAIAQRAGHGKGQLAADLDRSGDVIVLRIVRRDRERDAGLANVPFEARANDGRADVRANIADVQFAANRGGKKLAIFQIFNDR
jgi:hypothetical protein